MNRRLQVAALVSLGALASLPAAAQFQKPEDAIKYRQSALTVMSTHFGRVAAMAAGRIPYDAKTAADNAAIAVTMSRLPFVAFGEGTEKGPAQPRQTRGLEPERQVQGIGREDAGRNAQA